MGAELPSETSSAVRNPTASPRLSGWVLGAALIALFAILIWSCVASNRRPSECRALQAIVHDELRFVDASGTIHSELRFQGASDASAAASLGPGIVVTASDEARAEGGDALMFFSLTQKDPVGPSVDLRSFYAPGSENAEKEADIEAAARRGNRIYWLTSHGRSKSGEKRPWRQKFFATEIESPAGKPSVRPVGKVFPHLLRDILSQPWAGQMGFTEAEEKGRKPEDGGINIEGLAAAPKGPLLIGFRSPLHQGKAVLLPLENADDLIDGKADHARLGAPIALDLGGLAVRDLAYWAPEHVYLILAGSPTGERRMPKLLVWDADSREPPREVTGYDLPEDFDPEGVVVDPGGSVLIFSDDGDRVWPGRTSPNKNLPDAERSFRGIPIDVCGG